MFNGCFFNVCTYHLELNSTKAKQSKAALVLVSTLHFSPTRTCGVCGAAGSRFAVLSYGAFPSLVSSLHTLYEHHGRTETTLIHCLCTIFPKMTENEALDMLRTVQSTYATTAPTTTTTTGGGVATAGAGHDDDSASAGNSQRPLTFHQFIHLMSSEAPDFSGDQHRREMQQVFAALDSDQDGQLGEKDIQNAIEKVQSETTSTSSRSPKTTMVTAQTYIREVTARRKEAKAISREEFMEITSR